MGKLTVVYDACVLYPAPLRDFLMHLALTDLFHAKWTEAIHDEWTQNVQRDRPDIPPKQLRRTRTLMNIHVRDCLVTGYASHIPLISLPDPGDRHVLAAAITAGADVILTFNQKDFPAETLSTYGLRSESPDGFIHRHLMSFPRPVCLAAKRHRASLRKPLKNVDEYLETLERQRLPLTATLLRAYSAEI